MNSRIDILKGIHPNKFIERELEKQNISLDVLAKETGIPCQRINVIIAGTCMITAEETSKIEDLLKLEDGFLTTLQQYYDIIQAEDQRLADLYPIPPNIRESLFWDADFDSINWGKYKDAVVKRVFERGSEKEIEEIKRYYKL